MRSLATACCAGLLLLGSTAAPGAAGAAKDSASLPEDVCAAARLSVAPLTVEAAQAAVAKFQAAVSAGDARRVAAFARFPLRVNGPEGSRTIPDARAFRREFAALFDPPLRSRVATQSFATMPMGYRGLMLDDGRLWLQPACLKPGRDGGCRDADFALRLVAINVPAPEAPAR